MSYLEKYYYKYYITGDFNCNTLVSNTSTEEFKNILSSNHFYYFIYCNMPNISNTMAAGLLHANISDHKGIFVSIITPYSLKKMF